eukprot:evm.model.NODE_23340_length_2036_cov_20.368860.1
MCTHPEREGGRERKESKEDEGLVLPQGSIPTGVMLKNCVEGEEGGDEEGGMPVEQVGVSRGEKGEEGEEPALVKDFFGVGSEDGDAL